MGELDTLRPEVREALFNVGKRCDAEVFDTLTAELLRLAKAEFELMLALQDRLGVQDEYAVVAKGWQERAEKAEAELAALKAKVAESPTVTLEFSITGGWWINTGKRGTVPQAMHGKRVRLLVEN